MGDEPTHGVGTSGVIAAHTLTTTSALRAVDLADQVPIASAFKTGQKKGT